MIGLLFSHQSSAAGNLVLSAMARSVSRSQVQVISPVCLEDHEIVVAVDLPERWNTPLVDWLSSGPRKLIIFGKLSQELLLKLSWSLDTWPSNFETACRSAPAKSHKHSISSAAVRYDNKATLLGAQEWIRHFERFDFTDEWNNLGFGTIRSDHSCWAVSQPIHAAKDEIAGIDIDGKHQLSYAALSNVDGTGVLWYNRPVGPCDSFEWRVVENFLSGYGTDTMPCQPVLKEIPWGYDAAITSRLDCDEDVESARALWSEYLEMDVPFSLAVHTTNLAEYKNHSLLNEVLAKGGAVLSHSATHAANWGGSFDAASLEATESADLLRDVTGNHVLYAVSPFHQTPTYALHALSEAGYRGCIGGIISDNPEFVLARGGEIQGVPAGFIGHTQQCMLHGDCILSEGDPIATYKQAFEQAYQSCTMFGYLDHPFSERYAYGWSSEQARIDVHRKLIDFVKNRTEKPLFLNEEQALNFLSYRSGLRIFCDGGRFHVAASNRNSQLDVAIEYQGNVFPFERGTIFG